MMTSPSAKGIAVVVETETDAIDPEIGEIGLETRIAIATETATVRENLVYV